MQGRFYSLNILKCSVPTEVSGSLATDSTVANFKCLAEFRLPPHSMDINYASLLGLMPQPSLSHVALQAPGLLT